MASCVRNICTKNYQNLVIGFQVTVKNVGDVFLGHSVVWEILTYDIFLHLHNERSLSVPLSSIGTCFLHYIIIYYIHYIGYHMQNRTSFIRTYAEKTNKNDKDRPADRQTDRGTSFTIVEQLGY